MVMLILDIFVGDKGNGAPGGGSVIDRIDYGNDTATASPKGSLSPDVGYFFRNR